MKFILASAAAALVASSFGASAADLAKKAPVAVDYVKVCDAYGAGFFYIPGSDTCLKIGGYIRAQVVGGDDDFGNFGGDRSEDNFETLGRLQLNVDARSQTEFGILRGYGAVNLSATSVSSKGGEFELDQAYIQWAGFTAGHTQSFFDFFTGYAPAVYYGEIAHDNKVNLFAYTFAFGNGVSATISIEDANNAGRQEYATGYYGGNKAPDIIGAVKVEQAWGAAQVMAVAHNSYGGIGSTVDGIDEWGYAVGAGVTFKLPMLGADDEFGIQAVYSDGAIRYLSLGDFAGSYDFYTEGYDVSAGYSIFAGFKHGFTSKLVGALQGGYFSFDSDVPGNDFTAWDVSASLTWTPVTNLDLTGFVEYRAYDTDLSGSDPEGWVAGLRVQRNF